MVGAHAEFFLDHEKYQVRRRADWGVTSRIPPPALTPIPLFVPTLLVNVVHCDHGCLQGARVLIVTLYGSAFLCSQQASQCLSTPKVIALVVITVGVTVFSLAEQVQVTQGMLHPSCTLMATPAGLLVALHRDTFLKAPRGCWYRVQQGGVEQSSYK